ncbi:MAG: SBBP repeat-containing protein [Labilithrix sp.]|nr:SBBP repeat-containing protein [Labilithrix sp.]
MAKIRSSLLAFAALSLFLVDAPVHDAPTPSSRQASPPAVSAATRFARLPLRFERNEGQFTDGVRFVALRGATRLTLTDEGATLSLRSANAPRGASEDVSSDEDGADVAETTLSFEVAGGRKVTPRAEGELVTKTNYLLGNDPSRWRTNVANYARVTYEDVLDGVDLVYHGEEGQIEYDFVVKRGAEPKSVAMNVGGADGLSLSPSGDLVVHTPDGDFVQPAPRVYQRDAEGREVDVAARYRIVGARSVGFEVASYDRTRDLVIDPVLGFASYLGGAGTDTAYAVAVDAQGSAYVTGVATLGAVTAAAPKFPTTAGAYQEDHAVEAGGVTNVNDAFVAKFKADGSELVYATYLGGAGADVARAIAVDAAGNAYVGGYTTADDFPTTAGAFQAAPPAEGTTNDGFVTKLNATGSALVYSTYLGTTGADANDQIWGLAIDAAGSAYVTGLTGNTTNAVFPTTIGAYDTTRNGQDAFVTKLNANGTGLVFSTFLGGTGTEIGYGIALDAQSRAVVVGYTTNNTFPVLGQAQQYSAGNDAFVTKLNANGTELVFSTFLGGEGSDVARGVALDAAGNVYVVGDTASTTTSATPFVVVNALQPTNAGGTDIFVTKLDAAGANHLYATFLGTTGTDNGYGIAVTADGYATVAGYSNATGYPLRTEYQTHRGSNDLVVTKLAPNGGATAVYSTYIGSTGADVAYGIALTPDGGAVVVGNTNNNTFPVTAGAAQTTRYGTDAVVVKVVSAAPSIAPSPAAVTPKATEQFTASGGSGLDYAFSLQTNLSGGTITTAGLYTAGGTGNVTDVVRVTDSEGAVGTLDVAVGPGVAIAPAAPAVAPLGKITLTATGGSGEGYQWSLGGAPKGVITPGGEYTAPGTAGVSDTAIVEDSLGNTASVQISVGGGIVIAPATPKAPPRGTLTFTASGGSGAGYTWSLTQAPSGGTITAAGLYKAGTTPSVKDVARVEDSLGNASDVSIEVGPAVAITPANPSVNGGGAITFTATGGSGTYTWSLQAAPSQGTIDASSGIYGAGVVSAPVTDIVLATDSLGNSATTLVEVTPPTSSQADAGAGAEPADNATDPDADGGCSAAPSRKASSALGALVFALGALVLGRRRKR